MLPDIGAAELMVIAVVALVFVGPKDLPLMLRKLGQFTSKMRRMAADFRTSFDDMARQSELEDLRREVEQMRSTATQAMSDPIGVDSALRDTMQEVDAAMTGGEPFDYDPGVPYDEPATPYEAPEPVVAAEPAVKKPAARKKTQAAAAKPKPAATAAKAPAKPRRRAPSKIVT